MISDYYYATVIECTNEHSIDVKKVVTDDDILYDEKDATYKTVGYGIFKKSVDIDETYTDIETGETYTICDENKRGLRGKKYIDVKAGIIPIRKYLEYCRYTSLEKREIFSLLRANDQKERLESKLNHVTIKLESKKDKVRELKGLGGK